MSTTANPSNSSAPDHQGPNPSPESHQAAGPSAPSPAGQEAERWGTQVMGTPDNKKAALWGPGEPYHNQPYVLYTPVQRHRPTPMDSILTKFNAWGNKAEHMANNVWQNLRTGTSVPGDAWGKVNLAAKAISGGGFDSLYKQTFPTFPNETLKKTFACYLSTTTGPVAGTLYLSSIHVAFCSDRPLSFRAPSGQESWSYYKVMIPLAKLAAISPVIITGGQAAKYIQVVTSDGHDFWFMGFVNFDKASQHLSESISASVVPVVAYTHESKHLGLLN